MNAVRDVTPLIRSLDCVTPNCTREAEFNDGPNAGLCRVCAERLLKENLPAVTRDLADRQQPAKTRSRAPAAVWTEDRIIETLQAWATDHGGAAPYASQWKAAGAGRPTEQTVRNVFGGWDAALEAAGLTPSYPRAVLTVSPVPDVSGEQTREMGREWAARISEDERVDEVRIRSEATVGKEAEVTAPPRAEQIFEPFDTGAAEGMRATYVELLLERLEKTEIYQDGAKLMDRIERLLWPTQPSAGPPTKEGSFDPATEHLGRLGARAEVLMGRREKAWDHAAVTENELEPILTKIRKIADEWIINDLGGSPLTGNEEL